jgi:succinoglycan biosynthesis protein ExoW
LGHCRAAVEVRLDVPDHRFAVIIPFFQREPGILARALESIGQQQIPDGWLVEVIVVDDASPSPADEEIGNFTSDGPWRLRVIRQEHGGVAAARNRALDEADKDTALIAFLDSDDIWPATHLERMISALTAGYDFCFTDSRRSGYYDSYLRECAGETGSYIAVAEKKAGFSVIAQDEFLGLMLKEFPAQVSTVAYKRRIAPDLRFDTRLKAAGEDLLFLCMLVSMASSVAFDQVNCVECGAGLNMYFGNLSRYSPKRLAICVDQLIARKLIDKTVRLSPERRKQNDAIIKHFRRQFVFQTARSIVKFPDRVPKAMVDLIKNDTVTAMLLPIEILGAGFTLLRRHYGTSSPID